MDLKIGFEMIKNGFRESFTVIIIIIIIIIFITNIIDNMKKVQFCFNHNLQGLVFKMNSLEI